MDLYEVLGVERTATPEEIKKAYRDRSKECHPDKTGGKTTELFQRLSEAYEILSDPRKREIYDLTDSSEHSADWDGRIRKMIGGLFLELVLKGMGNNIVKDGIATITAQRETFAEKKREFERNIAKMNKAKSKVRRKDGKHSIFDDAIASQIAAFNEGIRECDVNYRLFTDLLAELDCYESDDTHTPNEMLLRHFGFHHSGAASNVRVTKMPEYDGSEEPPDWSPDGFDPNKGFDA